MITMCAACRKPERTFMYAPLRDILRDDTGKGLRRGPVVGGEVEHCIVKRSAVGTSRPGTLFLTLTTHYSL